MNLPPDEVIEERLVQREGGKLEADALFWALALGFPLLCSLAEDVDSDAVNDFMDRCVAEIQ
jgi:hypothetical protein